MISTAQQNQFIRLLFSASLQKFKPFELVVAMYPFVDIREVSRFVLIEFPNVPKIRGGEIRIRFLVTNLL